MKVFEEQLTQYPSKLTKILVIVVLLFPYGVWGFPTVRTLQTMGCTVSA